MKGLMMEAYLTAVIGCLFAILCGVLGWVGVRIFAKLDEVQRDMLSNYKDFCSRIDGFYSKVIDGDNILHGRVSEIDRRLIRVETKCIAKHGGD